MISTTDWKYHRINYATRFSHLSARAYARMFHLNENTARVRLKGALIDPENEPKSNKINEYWAFHRVNYAARFSFLSIKEYAWEVGLSSYNTARVKLRGALTDPANSQINLADYHPRTGERLPIVRKVAKQR